MDRCVYPDAMMLCGEPLFHDEQEDVILNPQVIVEVLSPSTKRYDQQTKSGFYRSIPSITDILLIAQDAFHIEHFTRKTDGAWVITPFNKPDDKLTILERTLNLATFYEGFDL